MSSDKHSIYLIWQLLADRYPNWVIYLKKKPLKKHKDFKVYQDHVPSNITNDQLIELKEYLNGDRNKYKKWPPYPQPLKKILEEIQQGHDCKTLLPILQLNGIYLKKNTSDTLQNDKAIKSKKLGKSKKYCKHQYGEHYPTSGISVTRDIEIAINKYGQNNGVVVKLDIKTMNKCGIKILDLSDKLNKHLIRYPEDQEVILVSKNFPSKIVVDIICSNIFKSINFEKFKKAFKKLSMFEHFL